LSESGSSDSEDFFGEKVDKPPTDNTIDDDRLVLGPDWKTGLVSIDFCLAIRFCPKECSYFFLQKFRHLQLSDGRCEFGVLQNRFILFILATKTQSESRLL
jgi:hypothetical protein